MRKVRKSVAEAEKVARANRNTIKDHMEAPTGSGHLEQLGAGRGSWYGLV
jgi:hypothetical protein